MKTALSLLLAFCVPFSASAQSANIRGFLQKDVAAEQQFESQAQAIPDRANLRKYMDFMAGEPHHAGSARSKAVAEYALGLMKGWGLDAHLEEFEALLPYPTARQVEVISPKRFTAKLKEPAVAQDPTTKQSHQLPTYNAYGASGDVTGEVVYVNYGIPEDYQWLADHGISVTGKIVIARYGRSWRGIKPKVAAEHGAIACLIYSDPHEDGYFEGDAYTKGPMRPAEGVQRGSVLDMPLYPGDPLSPGWASEKGSRRLQVSEAKTLVKIPVLPLSYTDAQPILDQLSGPIVPPDWRGALPITYHAGPGATRLHMKTDYDWTTKPLFDVVATIPGSQSPDEWVIAGNHHDAWVNGAEDPISGAVDLLETARSLATLQKNGWKPKRTIKVCLWDGEEFGLLGSTEWAEKHADELAKKAAVYLNSDDTSKGWINVSGSHTLEAFAADLVSDLHLPQQPKTKFAIYALGAGSDYVAFVDHLGIASMDAGFGGESSGGVYHSIYDSIYWYTHFGDTDFADGQMLSRYTATAILRLADAPVLPMEFGHLAATVTGYVSEIDKQAKQDGHALDFSVLRDQLEQLQKDGMKYEVLLQAASAKASWNETNLNALNAALIQTERVLLSPAGLPGRPWYKHQIYAPGFYTGYGVKTLPGIREAVDAKDWELAQSETRIASDCLRQLNAVLGEALTDVAGL